TLPRVCYLHGMKHLLLMRHGEAVDGAPGGDGDRWLTSHGRQTTRAVAEHLARHMAPATVWTSPLVRAVQTAEILASAVGLQGSVEVLRELATGHDDAILQHVADFEGDGTLCLVGHEPTLSQLAVTLLGVRQWPGSH